MLIKEKNTKIFGCLKVTNNLSCKLRWEGEELFDNGCTRYMTWDKSNFFTLKAFQGGKVAFGNGKKGEMIDVGKIGKPLSHAIDNICLLMV